jgi:hypothetical protein
LLFARPLVLGAARVSMAVKRFGQHLPKDRALRSMTDRVLKGA